MDSNVNYVLCETAFWNESTIWETNSPQFSPCFRDTILVWFPALVLILVIFTEYFHSLQVYSKDLLTIHWNYFNRLRILVTLVLSFLKLCQFTIFVHALLFSQDQFVPSSGTNTDISKLAEPLRVIILSTFIEPLLLATSYFLLAIIYRNHRKIGLHTSGSMWIYLLLLLVCNFVEFYSVINGGQSSITNITEYAIRLIHFPLLTVLFILECRGDTPTLKVDITDVRPECPELQASFCSTITFWWYNSFLLFGYRSRIKVTNLWKTLARDRASELVPIFKSQWSKMRDEMKKTKEKTYQLADGGRQYFNNIAIVLLKLFWSKLLLAACLKLIQDSLQFITPLVLKKLLAFMSSDAPQWQGTFFAMLLLVVPSIQSLILGNYFWYMQVIGLQVRSMIVGTIYRKALLLSGSSRLQSTTGEIVNLMAVDAHRFQDLLMYVNLFWSAPFQIVMAIILLYRELGWSVFAGVLCMALVLPANAYIANRIKFAQIKLMTTKDERIKQMNEVLGGIKVIKLYAWENSFMANLFAFRNKELDYLSRILNLDAVQTFLWQCSPFLVALVTFAVYVSVDEANILDAEKAFVSISLFNLLRFPLTMLPSLVTSMILAVVSSRRLNRFLNSDELVKYVTRNEESNAISIEGGSLAWSQNADEKADNRTILKDIDLHVKPNSFVAIVGQVASGKSSLISSILGEMHHISGRFNVCDSMSTAYVPQQAWIQNMTVRDNILFGSDYDEERYKKVLSVCSLQQDLDTLPGGDQAEIGEKGINLSGGQKQRVSLARACYSESDIYLLDDPLSALDSHVAKHVFDKVLSSNTGILGHKTRVLTTNSLFVLPYVDQIVVLEEGRIVESGTYRELMGKEKGHLSEFMRQYSGNQEEKEDINVLVSEKPSSRERRKSTGEKLTDGKILKSIISKPNLGQLIEVEKVELGSVGQEVYLSYFKAVSLSWLAFIVVSLIAMATFQVGHNLWLSVWSTDAEDPTKASDVELRVLRLVVYASLGALQCTSVLVGSLGLSKGAVRAANRLHSNLLESVMHSPMTFFDTTPIGRVVNRFAKDIDVVDSTLPGTFRSWLSCFLQVITTMLVICISFPTFFIIIIPLAIIYFLIQKVFIVTTRQLKRLESVTRSPIYSHFNETLSGISTIRAYDSVNRFVTYSDGLVDRNQCCCYPNVIANRWLSLRLEFFGNIITACAGLFSVYYKGTVGAGIAGLTISYSLNITQTLSWLVRMTSDLETHIVSVERILEYIRNLHEDLWVKTTRPASEWPNEGSIRLEKYSTRYRENTDLVLKDMSIEIRPSEKIGIVGRTGSGKSSLSLGLFRILEPASGRIIIDNLDVANYGLHDLRSKLTIIPQDPVLFSGSLRFNLDPLKLYTDSEIWRALDLAHLRNHVGSFESGLSYKVSEFGENFSIGQRQLICLARAILRKSKILILDEATASVDLETDSIVQKTIRDIFKDCTIITIAHRLHTILDSDRILVLERGEVKELDTPANLIGNPNSEFSSLARDAGVDIGSVIKALNEEGKDN